MRIVDIITTKRDGGELSRAEIEFFITKNETPPPQSRWLDGCDRLKGGRTAGLTVANIKKGHCPDCSEEPAHSSANLYINSWLVCHTR